jgi:hypothetical protein
VSLLKGMVAEILGPMPIAKIDTAAVLKVLEPMWTKTPETASRVRGRIQAVLDAGCPARHREGQPGAVEG